MPRPCAQTGVAGRRDRHTKSRPAIRWNLDVSEEPRADRFLQQPGLPATSYRIGDIVRIRPRVSKSVFSGCCRRTSFRDKPLSLDQGTTYG